MDELPQTLPNLLVGRTFCNQERPRGGHNYEPIQDDNFFLGQRHRGDQLGVWRNGSASDSRSEGWEFESLCPQDELQREMNSEICSEGWSESRRIMKVHGEHRVRTSLSPTNMSKSIDTQDGRKAGQQ